MCVCMGGGRRGDIRLHQIDLLFWARIPCYIRNVTRLIFFFVPDSVRSQQISQQILVNSTESGEKSNQNVQQIFTNLVSGPVSNAVESLNDRIGEIGETQKNLSLDFFYFYYFWFDLILIWFEFEFKTKCPKLWTNKIQELTPD